MSATRSPGRWLGPELLLGVALAACDLAPESKAEIVTSVEALRPVAARAPAMAGGLDERAAFEQDDPSARRPVTACSDVEHKAQELAATLPRQLDADTRATRVAAQGCDLRLEYELSTLSARDVSERGLRAMRGRVLDRLCADRGALAVMQRGGRFTNVYFDRDQVQIGLFTVAPDDCGI